MQVYIADIAALCICLLSSFLFYLACPNQQYFKNRFLGFYPMTLLSIVVLIPAWFLFCLHHNALAASFSIVYILMLGLGCVPLLSRLNQPVKSARAPNTKMIKSRDSAVYRPFWVRRIIGSTVLLYIFALGFSGAFGLFGPGPVTDGVKSQLVMWMIVPLWFIPLALVFFVRSLVKLFTILIVLTGSLFSGLWYMGVSSSL